MRAVSGLLACVFLLLSAPPALAGKHLPDVVEDALAYATTDRVKAIALLEDAWKAADGTDQAPILALYAGEQRRLNGDLDAAHLWFTRALADESEAGAELGLALVASDREIDSKTLAILEEPTEKDVLDTENADRYLLLVERAASQNDVDKVGSYTKKALSYAKEDPATQTRISERLQELAQTPSGPAQKGTTLDRAEAAMDEGRVDDARRLATQVRGEVAPDSLEAARAQGILDRIGGVAVNPNKIEVVLPLTGKFSNAAEQVEDAFEWGYKQGGGGAGLSFVDSGASAETAVVAIRRAALEDGAIAVVGPLLSEEAEASAQTADVLHLPLVSLSQGLDDAAPYTWVFQSALTPRQQVDALTSYLTTAQNMHSFGIFAPDNAYGTHATEIFTASAKAHGATIAASASYPADANVVSEPAAALAKQDSPKDNLQYDALFLPDNATRVPLATAGLAMEEFPMGTFAPHPNIRTIPLIGLNGWNNPLLVTAGNEYVRNSFFTDVFLATAGSARPAMADFTTAFKAEFNRTPTSLEAAAADAGRVVAAAEASHPTTREAFRTALAGAHPTGTVTGVTGFGADDRTLDREVLILTITQRGISIVDGLPTGK
jgi:ABC-type branched-subunit amino acid transport system substrate-binding protein